ASGCSVVHAGRCTTNMPDAAPWLSCNGPARRSHPPHQFDFFVIEEESLVEEAGLAKRCHPEHDASARDPINLSSDRGHDRDRRNSQNAIKGSSTRTARKLTSKCWEAKRTANSAAIGLEELAADRRHSGV